MSRAAGPNASGPCVLRGGQCSRPVLLEHALNLLRVRGRWPSRLRSHSVSRSAKSNSAASGVSPKPTSRRLAWSVGCGPRAASVLRPPRGGDDVASECVRRDVVRKAVERCPAAAADQVAVRVFCAFVGAAVTSRHDCHGVHHRNLAGQSRRASFPNTGAGQ